MTARTAAQNVVPLPRRATTRTRLVNAAKAVFFETGYGAATMEEIAQAAGTRRSTLYLHFREKEEILAVIAQEYAEKLRAVVALLPNAAPSREAVDRWVDEMADFVTRERTPTELLVAMTHMPSAPPAALRWGHDFQAMLAKQNPRFREAFEGPGMSCAWAITALEALGWALCAYVRTDGGEFARLRLAVAADLLTRFLCGQSPERTP
jgi:AcrR family transcriptional regulator